MSTRQDLALFAASFLMLSDSLLKLALERSYLCPLIHFLGLINIGSFGLWFWLGIRKRLHSLCLSFEKSYTHTIPQLFGLDRALSSADCTQNRRMSCARRMNPSWSYESLKMKSRKTSHRLFWVRYKTASNRS